MRRLATILVLLTAVADAAPPDRVLVADGDPELVRAIESSLAPWRIVVIADASVPDASSAHVRADAAEAQYIVWREGDQLVVFDREHGTTEHRAARAGAFDPVSAAAAALTVKTMLRLPPLEAGPDAPDQVTTLVGTAPVVVAPGPEVRFQLGAGGRVTRGSQTDLGARVLTAVMVRPWALRGWRIGIAADLGTATDISHAGFKGTWNDGSVHGVISWSTRAGASLEIEPWIAGGVSRSSFTGEESQTMRDETATLPSFRGGVTVRWPVGMWSIGASLGADALVGTPTYTRQQGMGMPVRIFEVPAFAMVLGLVAAVDLGR
ncbi:MAG: hypothetical protein JWP01_3749 [Myxococcales bacterium]|nr:hypothetical protein [Myxococcales bacterium]